MGFFKGDIQQKSLTEQLLEITNYFGNEMDRRVDNTNAQIAGIKNLVDSSMTADQITSAQNALSNISGTTGRWGETAVNHEVVQNILDNKKYFQGDYESALTELGGWIHNPNKSFNYKEEDWTKISTFVDKIVDDEGNPIYDSDVDLIRGEYEKYNALMARIQSGVKSGFRVGKRIQIGDTTYNEAELVQKLQSHKGRIDAGMEAMLTNGVITVEEAEIIMQSLTRDDFINWRNEKNNTISKELTFYDGNIKSVERIQRNFLGGQLTGDDMFMIGNLGIDFGNLTSTTDTDGNIDYNGVDANGNPLNSEEDLLDANEQLQNELDRNINQRNIGFDAYRAVMGYDWGTGQLIGPPTNDDEIDDDDDGDDDGDGDVKKPLTVQQQMDAEELEQIFEGIDETEKVKTEKELIDRYGTSDVKEIKKILSEMTPDQADQNTYLKKHNLPDDPTIKSIEDIESVGGQFMHQVVNREIDRDEYNKIINSMISGDFGTDMDITTGDGHADITSRASANILRNMWGNKLLTKKQWETQYVSGKKGEYGESYKQYIEIYTAAADYFEEYFNPREEDINRLDSFLKRKLSMSSMKWAFGGVATGTDRVSRKWWTPGDRRKLRKIWKLYDESNLSLEEFKKQYETEYLNMARIFKYGASKKQSHSALKTTGLMLPSVISANNMKLDANTGHSWGQSVGDSYKGVQIKPGYHGAPGPWTEEELNELLNPSSGLKNEPEEEKYALDVDISGEEQGGISVVPEKEGSKETTVKNLVSRSPIIKKILVPIINAGLLTSRDLNEFLKLKNIDLESILDKPYKIVKILNEFLPSLRLKSPKSQ